MRTNNINAMKAGWLVGDFEPSLFRSRDVEIAHHFHKSGFRGKPHVHMVATEYNYIVKGRLRVHGNGELATGDVFTLDPGEVADVEFLEDTDLVVIKTPSVPGDKYDVGGDKMGISE